jgi:hypothetical protein
MQKPFNVFHTICAKIMKGSGMVSWNKYWLHYVMGLIFSIHKITVQNYTQKHGNHNSLQGKFYAIYMALKTHSSTQIY